MICLKWDILVSLQQAQPFLQGSNRRMASQGKGSPRGFATVLRDDTPPLAPTT